MSACAQGGGAPVSHAPADKVRVAFTLNGAPVEVLAAATDRLIDVLRGALGLVGTREGCGAGECGSCTVEVDGRAVPSCILPAREAEGRSITTIEGLGGPGGELDRLQRAFVEHGGVQCGFCTPGMVMAARSLLRRNPHPSPAEIRTALAGNLCRCTGYVQIVAAVDAAGHGADDGGAHG
ncbi:MAG: (2Fe-2S)-binding protein [Myxococcales bacterium]|nr:(2Fe-2S)-binding protein [Myxococcales bacterium]